MKVASFIAEVRKRESLWATKILCSSKKDKDMTDMLWLQVGNIFNISEDAAKRKWRSLRDTFVRMLRVARSNGKEVSPWVHFKHMAFLLERADLFSIRPSCPQRSAKSLTLSPPVTPPITSLSSTDAGSPFPQDSDTNIRSEELQNMNNTTQVLNQGPCVDGPPPLVMIAPKVTKPSFTSSKEVYTIQDDDSYDSENQQYDYPVTRVELESEFSHSEEQTTKETDADTENLSFFRSIIPSMTKLNTEQQLKMRISFQEILLDEFRT